MKYAESLSVLISKVDHASLSLQGKRQSVART